MVFVLPCVDTVLPPSTTAPNTFCIADSIRLNPSLTGLNKDPNLVADSDNDIDQDNVCGDVDNCPTDHNPGQEDSDGD